MKLNNWIRLRPQRERPVLTGLLVSPLVPDLGHPGVGVEGQKPQRGTDVGRGFVKMGRSREWEGK